MLYDSITYKTVKASHFKKLKIIQKTTWRKVLSGKRREKNAEIQYISLKIQV